MLVIVAADQVTKWLVVENIDPATAYPVIGDVARLYLIRNPGAAFSMGADATLVFSIIRSSLSSSASCSRSACGRRGRWRRWH